MGAEEEAMKLAWIVPGLLAGLGIVAAPADAAVSLSIGVTIHSDHGHAVPAVSRREGYERGYRAGLAAGARDWQRREAFSLWRHPRYRSADSGYRARYGSRSLFRQAYRRGFEEGYRLGYAPPPRRDRRDRRGLRIHPSPHVRH
jgi:hypothetical protein